VAEAKIVFSLRDKLSARLDKINRKFKPLNRKLDVTSRRFSRLKQKTERATSAFRKLGSRLTSVGRQMSFMATLPLAAFAGLSVRRFVEFEEGLVGIQKTTNLTAQEIKVLGQRFTDISNDLPLTTKSLNAFGQVAGQAGIEGAENIEKFAVTFAKLETASDIAGEEGALAIAQLLSVIGEGPENVDRFSSALVNLGNNLPVTESQINEMAVRVGQATKVFNFSSSEVLGFSAAMRAAGVRAESGGTQVQKSLFAIRDAISDGGPRLQALAELTGTAADQLKERFGKDAAGVLRDFVEGLGFVEKSGGDSAKVLAAFGLDGERAKAAILPLAVEIGKLDNALNLSKQGFEDNIALEKEFGQRTKTLGASLTVLSNNFNNLAKLIGDILSPAIRALASIFQGLFKFFQNNKVFATFAVILGSIVAVAGPLVFIFGAFLTILPALKLGFAALSISMAVVALKALLIIGAIGLIIFAIAKLIQNFEFVKAFLIRLWDTPLAKVLRFVFGIEQMIFAVKALIFIFKSLKPILEPIFDFIVDALAFILGKAQDLVEFLIGIADKFLLGNLISDAATGNIQQERSGAVASATEGRINQATGQLSSNSKRETESFLNVLFSNPPEGTRFISSGADNFSFDVGAAAQ